MNKLSAIQNVIADSWEIKEVDKKELIEKQKNKLILKATITSEGQYLLYKFEKDGNMEMPYLKKNKDVKKICDYVLFTLKKDTLFVLLFELKNGKANPVKQLKATEILSKYFIETANRVSKESFKKVEYRGIGITNKAVKATTKSSKIYNKNKYVQWSSKNEVNIKVLCI